MLSKHILVVDDDPLVCETVAMLLQFDGHSVTIATSGAQALGKLDENPFDLVITDFSMPLMKGDELADAIKKRDPCQPVLMLTADPEKLQTREFPLTSVDFFVSKPFKMESLREAVAKSNREQLVSQPVREMTTGRGGWID